MISLHVESIADKNVLVRNTSNLAKYGKPEMVNWKTQRYAGKGLKESAVHIAQQINSL